MPIDSVPDLIGNTPLVRLRRVAVDCRVPVLVKCEHLNPGGSVKDRIAKAIIDDAEATGRLKPGDTLVEATAGNTGVGLALLAAVRGYKLVCVMPEKMSIAKRRALQALGARVVISDNAPPDDPRNFQNHARRLAQEPGCFLTDQFRNPANPDVHEQTTGAEILRQTRGDLSAFVAGVGTGGTLTGVGRALKAAVPGVRIVVADPAGSRLAGLVRDGELGPDGSYALEGIGVSVVPEVCDLSVIDDAVTVTDTQAFDMAERLVREEGLLVGGSSGAAVVAALHEASRRDVRRPVVAILADSWDRYQTSHFDPAWRLERGL
jgi:cystathionine beta-synthase